MVDRDRIAPVLHSHRLAIPPSGTQIVIHQPAEGCSRCARPANRCDREFMEHTATTMVEDDALTESFAYIEIQGVSLESVPWAADNAKAQA